ncbi:MAG: hypothetical protein GX813_00840 [Erysipelotrichia bacterium]|nr:hypothetical protein [Erysipelotrichia bacterium]
MAPSSSSSDPSSSVPHEHVFIDEPKVEASPGYSAYTPARCLADDYLRLAMDIRSDLNGKLTARGNKLLANGDEAMYKFKLDVSFTAKLLIKATYDSSRNGQYSFYAGKVGNSTVHPLPDGGVNTEVKFNGDGITLPTATYSELGMTGTTEAGAAFVDLGHIAVVDGDNTLTIKRLDSYSLNYYEIWIVQDSPAIPHVHDFVDEPKVEASPGCSAYTPARCAFDDYLRLAMDIPSDLNGKLKTRCGKLGVNGDEALYTFNLDVSFDAKFIIKGTYDHPNNGGYSYYTGKAGGSGVVDPLPNDATNTVFKFNDVVVELPKKSFNDLGMTGTTEAEAAFVDLGHIAVVDGDNTLTIKRLDSFGLMYFELWIVQDSPAIPRHDHVFVAGEKDGAYTQESCSVSALAAYRFDIADAEGWNKPNDKMNGKTPPDNASTWSLDGLPVGKYRVEINVQLTSSSHVDRYWFNMALAGIETSPRGDSESEDPYRYWLEVDGDITYPDEEASFGDLGFSSNRAATGGFISEIDVEAGAENLVLKHGDIGYSLIIKYVRFIAMLVSIKHSVDKP